MSIDIEKRVVEAYGGRSVKNIAETLGYNYHTFRNWINGKRDIPPEAIVKIAETATVSIDWLLTGEGFIPPIAESKSHEEVDLEQKIIEIVEQHFDVKTKEPQLVIKKLADSVERKGAPSFPIGEAKKITKKA